MHVIDSNVRRAQHPALVSAPANFLHRAQNESALLRAKLHGRVSEAPGAGGFSCVRAAYTGSPNEAMVGVHRATRVSGKPCSVGVEGSPFKVTSDRAKGAKGLEPRA